MKKIILGCIAVSSIVSPLFSMAKKPTEVILPKPGARPPAPPPLPEALPIEELEVEPIRKEYEKALEEELPQVEEQTAVQPEQAALYLTNNSKWNAVVRYKHLSTQDQEISRTLGRKGSKNDTLKLFEPDEYTDMLIFPDSPTFRDSIDTYLGTGKIKKRNLIKQIKDLRTQHPDESIQINVIIPKLPGGKFEGFDFQVTPRKPRVAPKATPPITSPVNPETKEIIEKEEKKLKEEYKK